MTHKPGIQGALKAESLILIGSPESLILIGPAESLILIGSAIFGATFILVTRVGLLKDSSLEINSFALNNCFSCKNFFQNGFNALSKMFFFFFLIHFFSSKSSKFREVLTIRFCSKFTTMWYKHFFKECMERLSPSNVSISNGSREKF